MNTLVQVRACAFSRLRRREFNATATATADNIARYTFNCNATRQVLLFLMGKYARARLTLACSKRPKGPARASRWSASTASMPPAAAREARRESTCWCLLLSTLRLLLLSLQLCVAVGVVRLQHRAATRWARWHRGCSARVAPARVCELPTASILNSQY